MTIDCTHVDPLSLHTITKNKTQRMQIHSHPDSCPTCNDAHHTPPRQAAHYNLRSDVAT
jgi:hypothetical protein